MKRRVRFLTLMAVAAITIGAASPATTAAQQGQEIIVASTSDSGAGTLRQALQRATAGTTITFDPAIFPPDDPATIAVASPLPELDQGQVTIDASNAGVILDGNDLPPGDLTAGLRIVSSGNVVRGLRVLRFPGDGINLADGAQDNIIGGDRTVGAGPTGQGNVVSLNGSVGVALSGAGTTNNLIIGNYIGTDPTGTMAWGNEVHGVMIQRSSHNTIGGTAPGEANLISGNQMSGVRIEYPESVGNVVIGNYIGADVSGSTSLGFNLHAGVSIAWGASENTIGGLGEGERNLISGNTHNGVYIGDTGTMNNAVLGNWIGPYMQDARQAFPSDIVISPNYVNDCTMFVATISTGVHKSIDCGSSWSEVNNGVTESKLRQIEIPAGASDANTIIGLTESSHLLISTDGAATWRLASTSLEAIDLRNIALSAAFVEDQTMYASAEHWSSEEYGGGPGVFKSTDGGATWRRMVNGMSDHHVWRVVASPDFEAKEVLVALTHSGVELSPDGGESWSMLTLPDPDVIDLALSPTYASDQTIMAASHTGRLYFSNDGGGNWTGVNALCDDPGFLALSPDFASDGIACHICGGVADTVCCSFDGGHTWVRNDVPFSGHLSNQATAIAFSSGFGSDATIFLISIAGISRSTDRGTTWEIVRGLRDPGNLVGISISSGASHNTIGPQNLISNNHDGLVINGADTANNRIIGNLVGTDLTGTTAQANSCEGLSIRGGHDNRIGGITDEDRNIISGNMCAGVWLGFADTQSNTVSGNFIGTDISGSVPLGNAGEGGVSISAGAHENVIGGDTDGERNVISGNERDGVFLIDTGTIDNTIRGNYIGLGADGTNPLRNSGAGVSLTSGAAQNNIGPGNVIAFNNGSGVLVFGDTSTGNRITQNSIYSNGGLGIEARSGGNLELAPPTITKAGSRLLSGTAPPNATLEFFSDDDDQGRIYEGTLQADEQGLFAFSLPTGRFIGPNVTATATNAEGNSSPFSAPETPPSPAVTRELPGLMAPTQVSTEPSVVGTNLGLALFSVLFFGFTSTVFNAILVDYRDELTAVFGKLLPRRFSISARRRKPLPGGPAKRWRRMLWLIWLAVLLGTSVIESFLDPEIGMLSPERMGVILTMFISAVVVSGLELGADLVARRRWAPAVRPESKIQWVGIGIAVACVILSRAMAFKPGYLYGIVGAIYLMPKFTNATLSGKRATFVLLTVFGGGLVIWTAAAFLPVSLTELEPIFLTIFLISLQGVFFELFPLSVTDGGDIWSWRRGAWIAFFTIVFFCFYHFLLNPNASDLQALQQNGVQTLLILIAVFGLATLTLWLLFPFRLRRRQARQP
ncbi:MAG: hypothetical protein PVF70_10495 [Anaerolineales bacterium]|jgi:hypothetical protein